VNGVYLNHAGTSWPKPASVQAAVREALVTEPVAWSEAFAAAQARLEAFLGLGPNQRLLLTPGCTSALALGIQDQPWRAGDGVALSAFEHVAVERPCAGLRRLGVQVHVLPPAPDGLVDLGAAERVFRSGSIRLLVVSAAANTTGELLPVRDLAEMARRHGARVLVDAAQVVGWIDMQDYLQEADLVAFGGHKGLQGVWGIGGLITTDRAGMSTPRLDGERSAPDGCDGGSVDRAALAGLAAAVDWLDGPGGRGRLERARGLSQRLQDQLQTLTGLELVARGPANRRMPIVAVRGPKLAWARARLEKAGVVFGVGLQCAPLAHRTLGTGPDGTLRFSFGPGSDAGAIETLMDVLSPTAGGEGPISYLPSKI